MRIFWTIGLPASLLGFSLSACVEEKPKTAFETVLIEGRTHQTSDGIRLSYPGTRLRFKTCEGPVKFVFEAVNSTPDTGFDVVMSGQDFGSLMIGKEGAEVEYVNPHEDDGLEIEFIRRNEAWQGDIIFKNAEAQAGFCKPTPFPKTKLLFIGDSITAGSGTQSRLNDAGERVAVSNARVAYPRVLGNRLNAQVHHLAYGGRGVTRDWQGITETNNAPQFYDRVLPDQAEPLWDPKAYQADIVSIMLGTNDFNPGIPDRESWTAAYRILVERVRMDYPQAQVFLISSPMTDGEKGNALKDYVSSVAASFETPQVRYIEVDKYYGEAWDSHPTAAEHQKIADELEPFFREHLDKSDP